MRTLIEYNKLLWVDIVNPTEDDFAYLKDRFNLHPLTLRNVIPSIMHPDFNVFQDYISMILHYPRNEETGHVEIYELDIIAGKNFIITNHYQPIKPLSGIFDACANSSERRKECMGDGSGHLLFLILNRFLNRILEKTDKINEELHSVEKEIFTGEERKTVEKISYLKRRILSFWNVTNTQEEVFASLKTTGPAFFGQKYTHYFSNLLRIYKRIDNSIETYKETIESLEETNHSIVNLKRNEIMTILTLFSVIMLPLTLLASIWGMNTNFLPFMQSEFDFWMIVGLMSVVLFGMIIYFKYKKWL
ncbi:MAG: magnesium transporter CorA family protein [Candidatus Moraniibacteriota bacterium]